MRLALLSTASAVAVLACMGPAAAKGEFSGIGQLHIGAGDADSAGFFGGKSLDDPLFYGAKGRGYWPLSPDVHLQADLFIQQTDDLMFWDGSEGWPGTDATEFGAALHLLHPFEDRGRFGIAGSIWNNEVFDLSPDGTSDVTYALAALEGQFFGADWTATAQAGLFGDFSCNGDGGESCLLTLDEGEFIRGKLRYFLHDNTAFNVEMVRMWGSFDDELFGGKSVTLDYISWAFEAEHRFERSQFSAFIGLAHEETEVTGFLSSEADTSTVSIGLRFYCDQPTLRSFDRTGAELETPQFGNALELATPLGLFASAP